MAPCIYVGPVGRVVFLAKGACPKVSPGGRRAPEFLKVRPCAARMNNRFPEPDPKHPPSLMLEGQ